MKIGKKDKLNFAIFAAISITLFIFYLFYVNLSTDTVTIFLPAKLFLGRWLKEGIFPLYNPHIFVGVPFAFDLGLGNFHPFNLFFSAPYPLSFALWVGFSSALFLIGFYLMFENISKNKNLSFILTLILFFSGSGFWRLDNPTTFLVIAHYGIFAFSLKNLKLKGLQNWIFPLTMGVLMTLSGHIQFVLYGYLLGLIILLFIYKINLKKILGYYFCLFLLTSWYYLLSLPLVLGSTRITTNINYIHSGSFKLIQLIQLFLPFVFGQMSTGARWNIGSWPGLLISTVFLILLLYLLIKTSNKSFFLILLFLFLIAMGFLNFPFLRDARQIFILIHIFGLIIIAKNEKSIIGFFIYIREKRRLLLLPLILFILVTVFFYSGDSSKLFFIVYRLVKHRSPGIFFDAPTIVTISQLIGKSFLIWSAVTISLLIASYSKKPIFVLIIYVILEGFFVNYYHNYFIPARILQTKNLLPKVINFKDYRVQSASEVIPFFGFYNYVNDFYFRPPFSKEKPIFDEKESKSFKKLEEIFSFIPSSWSTVIATKAIQGHNTFVPKKIAQYFKTPSVDFEKEHKEIIKRNPAFLDAKSSLDINAIEMRTITLYDKRWQDLGVRYFISNKPLNKYKLIAVDSGRYFYKDEATLPIWRLVSSNEVTLKQPRYEDPNQMVFKISKDDVGKKLEVVVNSDGFLIYYNGRVFNPKKEAFKIIVDLNKEGRLKLFYSPLFHLQQIVTTMF